MADTAETKNKIRNDKVQTMRQMKCHMYVLNGKQPSVKKRKTKQRKGNNLIYYLFTKKFI
jgi:hypothetical protein